MQVKDVYEWLDSFAPFDSCAGFDNAGLLVGNGSEVVSGVLFCMDVTPDAVKHAAECGANLIVSHHPLIFHPLKRVDTSAQSGMTLQLLLESGIRVISAHTNLDAANGGISDSLAECIGLQGIFAPDLYLRVGDLERPVSQQDFQSLLAEKLGAPVRMYFSNAGCVRRVAVAGGAYGEGYDLAVQNGADAFVVGEIKHHELLDACARQLTVYDAGHFATEYPGVEALYRRFVKTFQGSVTAVLEEKRPFIVR